MGEDNQPTPLIADDSEENSSSITPVSSAPEISDPAVESRRGRMKRILEDTGATVLASVLATVIASGVYTAIKGNISGYMRAVHDGGSLRVHGDMGNFVPYYPTELKATSGNSEEGRLLENSDLSTKTGVTPEKHFNKTIEAPMPWSIDFAEGPEARDTSLAKAEIENAAGIIKNLQSKNYEVEVRFRGHASDESDKSPGAGLGIKDQKNVVLATARGLAGANELKKILSAEGIDGVPVVNMPGKEVIDLAQDQKIVELAKTVNMTTDELVKKFNRQQLPKELAQQLMGLAQDRYDTIQIFAKKKGDPFIMAAQRVVTGDGIKTNNSGGNIFIILIIIPLFRRRRLIFDESSSQPLAPTIDGPIIEPVVLGDVPTIDRMPSVKLRPVIERPKPKEQLSRMPKSLATETPHRIIQPRPYNYSGNHQGGPRRGNGGSAKGRRPILRGSK